MTRQRKIVTSLVVIGLTLTLCLAFALLGANAAPRLLVALLGLERAGSPASAFPPDPPPLTLRGETLDHAELLLPPYITEPLRLDTAPDEMTVTGQATTVSIGAYGAHARVTSTYLLTLSEGRLNELLRRQIVPADATQGRYRDVTVELHPGGLILYADVHLGLRWQRLGLMLTHEAEERQLHPTGIVLDETLYALPPAGSLARALLPGDFYVERTLRGVTIVGPQPGEAHLEAARFHAGRLTLLARASYETTPPPDTGWQALAPGVELREIAVDPDGGSGQSPTERLRIVRLDPARVRFRVRYNPGEPRPVSAWAASTSALLVLNGSYFTPESESGKETLGLLISDGQRHGAPLDDFAGMFAVTADEQVSVRWLRERPYDPAESLTAALQSFPVLVKPGGVMGFPADADDGATARRTVVAQDRAGNILIIVAPRGTLSLHALSVFLAEAELDPTIDVALNLDGGSSTGLWLSAGEVEIALDSATSVPSVITVERR